MIFIRWIPSTCINGFSRNLRIPYYVSIPCILRSLFIYHHRVNGYLLQHLTLMVSFSSFWSKLNMCFSQKSMSHRDATIWLTCLTLMHTYLVNRCVHHAPIIQIWVWLVCSFTNHNHKCGAPFRWLFTCVAWKITKHVHIHLGSF